MNPLAAGSIFARDFRVERALAEGGMGAVYVVHQLSTGRRRALKLMQPELVQDEGLRRRFLLEAKVGASIASEHVVEVQAAGIDEETGAPFLVMELLDGEDLETRLERRGALSIAATRELFRQMCHALRLAHAAGIVHRDLKPANIFLASPKRADEDDAAFHVKVLDFGIAKMTTEAAVGGATTGMIGTPMWMAPEQADQVPVTPAADVWSLGLILYTCVTGHTFWRSGSGVSFQQLMREVLVDPIPRAGVRAAEQGNAFPPALESMIARSVVRKPSLRLPDAGAFLAALENALVGKALPEITNGEIELDLGGPRIDLALERTPRSISIVAPPDARTITTPARPAALAEGWRAPWWLVYLVPIAVVAAFVGAAYAMMHPDQPVVTCRLCTVESTTFANGQLPLRELRHDIEERFPELDAKCVRDAKESGRSKLKWTIQGGDVARGATVTGGGRTGECLLGMLTRGTYRLGGADGLALGQTDVTYTLEWNPRL